MSVLESLVGPALAGLIHVAAGLFAALAGLGVLPVLKKNKDGKPVAGLLFVIGGAVVIVFGLFMAAGGLRGK